MHRQGRMSMVTTRQFPRLKTFALVGLLSLSSGCAARIVTVRQEDRINTAMHIHRPLADQTGDPLEVSIVCVYPDDLQKPENERLKPDSSITAKDWYDFRPTGMPDGQHFNLPANQVYLLTDEKTVFGKIKGPALKGAIEGGTPEREVKGIQFKRKLHSKKSVIYVFPKFIDKNGEVLPVRPVKFGPPGAYTRQLFVKIGVDTARPHSGQYIENQTKRRLHGREKED